MSIKLMSAVWEHGPKDKTQKLILLSLADFADHDGSCFPSYQTTADRCGIERRTAIRVIKTLEAAGWLTVDPQTRANGSHTANRIWLNVARLFSGDPTPPPHSDTGSPPSDTMSPPSDTRSLPSDTVSPLDPLSDPSINRQENREERESAPPPVPDDLQSWFKQHKIPEPRSAADLALIRSLPARLWLNITMRWPGWSGLRRIVDSLGPQPDEVALRATQLIWETNDYSPRNIAGFLERYHAEADRPSPNGRANQPVISTPEGVDKARAWLAAALAGDIQ